MEEIPKGKKKVGRGNQMVGENPTITENQMTMENETITEYRKGKEY